MKPQTTQCMYQTMVHVPHLSEASKGGIIITYIYIHLFMYLYIHMYMYIIIMNNIIMNDKIRHLGNNEINAYTFKWSLFSHFVQEARYLGGSSNSCSSCIPNFIDFLCKMT